MSKVLITGGSSGIGRELAFQFAERDFDLMLISSNRGKLEAVQKEILARYSIECRIAVYDLADRRNLDKIGREHGVDMLVNCAGVGRIGDIQDMSLEEEMKIIDVNFTAALVLTKIFIRKFLEKGEGAVINICSTASLHPNPFLGAYSSSKAGLLYYSMALDEEVRRRNRNVRVISVCPGPVSTGFMPNEIRERFPSYMKGYEMAPKATAVEIMKCYDRKRRFSVVGFRNRAFIRLLKVMPLHFQLKLIGNFLYKGVLSKE